MTMRPHARKQRGPAPDRIRQPFNFERDPLGVKPDLLRYRITAKKIAARSNNDHTTVLNVLAGRARSSYIEHAVRVLIAEAREREAAEPTAAREVAQ
jgi:hypothetical protein